MTDILDLTEQNIKIKIEPVDEGMLAKIKANWDKVAKPLDSLGVFEKLHARIGAIRGEEHPNLQGRIVVFCADNGIVAEGVSQSDQSITAICAGNIAAGKSAVGIMAEREGTEILAVDIGMNTDRSIPLVRNEKVRAGSRNFHEEPALTRDEVLQAIGVGIRLAGEAKEQGMGLVGMGEMGIGNTTTSSAVAAALLGVPASTVTGRGAGLSDSGLARKVAVIDSAIERYDLYHRTPLEVVTSVGGYDIAALAGLCIGGAMYHIPVVLDGFISMTAALAACRMVPGVRDFLIPSHSSREPGAAMITKELELEPMIYADMALGEGTGAALAISLLRTAARVYEESCSFAGAGIKQYERHDKK